MPKNLLTGPSEKRAHAVSVAMGCPTPGKTRMDTIFGIVKKVYEIV